MNSAIVLAHNLSEYDNTRLPLELVMSEDSRLEKSNTPCKKSDFKTTAKSVGAAFFGVQSNKNRQRDFSQGKLSHFIIAGLIGVAIFIAGLVAVVSLVLP